jgi:hypothetical protein
MAKKAQPLEAQTFHDSEVSNTEGGDFSTAKAIDYSGHKLGFDPFATADISTAELHQQCKLVRDLRELKENQHQRACDCCGLPLVRNI